MRQRLVIWSVILVASAAAAVAAVPIGQREPPVALARGGSGTMCHCPCKTPICDCTMHSETCHRCYGIQVNVSRSLLEAMLASDEPVLESRHASWFDAAPYPELRVRLEHEAESMEIRFVPDPRVPSRYVPDVSFDPRAYLAWARRVDLGKDTTLSVGAKDDPGTWRILDGSPQHLNDSLEKSFRLVRADGSGLEVFRSESTLGWEANLYLRAVVAGIPEDALLGDPTEARGKLLSLLDLTDLQMKAGDASGAIRSLDGLIDAGESRWLDPAHEETKGALCGFRKIRNLLVPGSSCS